MKIKVSQSDRKSHVGKLPIYQMYNGKGGKKGKEALNGGDNISSILEGCNAYMGLPSVVVNQ